MASKVHLLPTILPQDGLLRARQIAQLFNIDPATLYRWIQRGDFPAPVRIGRASMWRGSTVKEWLDVIAPHQAYAGPRLKVRQE